MGGKVADSRIHIYKIKKIKKIYNKYILYIYIYTQYKKTG